MECIDCIQARGKDFEELDENNCCPQCGKTLCPYCEDHMYDAKEERMCEYCDEDRYQVCAGFISEGLYGLCRDKRQNMTSNTVLNMFLWLVLNHKNFEYTLCRNCF